MHIDVCMSNWKRSYFWQGETVTFVIDLLCSRAADFALHCHCKMIIMLSDFVMMFEYRDCYDFIFIHYSRRSAHASGLI